jgi:hypothetical protein
MHEEEVWVHNSLYCKLMAEAACIIAALSAFACTQHKMSSLKWQ